MEVLKFGGTSVGSVTAIKSVAQIVNENKREKIIVLSAMSGTTNDLLRLFEHIKNNQPNDAKKLVTDLNVRYQKVVNDLYKNSEVKKEMGDFINSKFDAVARLINTPQNLGFLEREIVAQGEILSTHLFTAYLKSEGVSVVLLNALDFMEIDEKSEPAMEKITENLQAVIRKNPSNLYITQGFICLDHNSEINNLKRGGSDYTASILGACLGAEIIQIWTDIDGLHNNDPRYVGGTRALPEISFDEASELAYFGAKILHPQSVIPAREKDIPVLLKNTFSPNSTGTKICNCDIPKGVRAIAAKDGIIAIKIKSFRMLMAYGFLGKIFEIFERYKTPIDIITTSEVAVSLTIDDDRHLEKIKEELAHLGTIEIDKNMTIVCLAGNFQKENRDLNTQIFRSLEGVPVRMISYGGSKYNISILIESEYKTAALQQLNKGVF